jgi:hypothetical protein
MHLKHNLKNDKKRSERKMDMPALGSSSSSLNSSGEQSKDSEDELVLLPQPQISTPGPSMPTSNISPPLNDAGRFEKRRRRANPHHKRTKSR